LLRVLLLRGIRRGCILSKALRQVKQGHRLKLVFSFAKIGATVVEHRNATANPQKLQIPDKLLISKPWLPPLGWFSVLEA
jgi:hypothetical protein